MKIPLHFGTDGITLEIPSKNVADVLRPQHLQTHDSNADIVSNATKEARGQFEPLAAGVSVGVLLPDGTRDLPIKDILLPLLGLLKAARNVTFFLCTGSHRPDTPENTAIREVIEAQTAQAGIVSYEIISHDCQSQALSNAGVTSRGTGVLYNSRLDEVDCFCILSDIKHHYFAGYSNPVKNIVPGLCGFQTVQQNHSLTFDNRSRAGIHPWHPDPSRRENPLAADLLEAMEQVVRQRPVWALVTVSDAGAIQWAAFGPAKDVASQGFQKADTWNMRTVDRVDRMVISPGGLPNDVDLYIGQRALELTASVVADGGQVLFLAACPNGIGSELTRQHFERKLTRPLPDILQHDFRDYHLYEHKPYRFARLIQRLEKLWLYTEMSNETVRSIHMTPSDNPQAVVEGWIGQNPDAKIRLVDGANKLLLMPRDEPLPQ